MEHVPDTNSQAEQESFPAHIVAQLFQLEATAFSTAPVTPAKTRPSVGQSREPGSFQTYWPGPKQQFLTKNQGYLVRNGTICVMSYLPTLVSKAI
jgi:hypothetical protein